MTDAVLDHDGLQVIPFYFVCDVSASMAGDRIDAVNDLLPTIKSALQLNTFARDLLRVGLVSFSDDVQVDLPITDLTLVEVLPLLETRGGTMFSGVLRSMRAQIQSDYALLKGDGFQVKRPIVVLLTDGVPTEDRSSWERAFAELTDPSFKQFPNIIPVGIGESDRDVVKQLRWRKDGRAPAPALFPKDGVDVGAALSELVQSLAQSVVNSAAQAAQGSAGSAGAFGAMTESLLVDDSSWDAELDE